MKMAVENAEKFVRKDKGLHINENLIHNPTMFDGSCSSRDWAASRRIVSAIPENPLQISCV